MGKKDVNVSLLADDMTVKDETLNPMTENT